MAKVIGAGIEEVWAIPCDLSATTVLAALSKLGEVHGADIVVASIEWQGGYAARLAERLALGYREDASLVYQDSWYVEDERGRRVGSWAP